MQECVVVLDFGSQYTQVIARRCRENRVYSKIVPFNTPVEEIKKEEGLKGVILSGGPASVRSPGSPRPDPGIWDLGVPILGICYGLQLMATMLGGEVAPSDRREFGHGILSIKNCTGLFHGFTDKIKVWNSHGDHLTRIPEGFETLATTENSDFAAIAHKEKPFFGLQFHPEVSHTEQGSQLLRNFLYTICGCEGLWTMADFAQRAMEDIRETVGKDRVILATSGGVDSSVAAALIDQAIGDQLTCIFVDNGLLRHKEVEAVEEMFKAHFRVKLNVSRSADRFLDELKGVVDPEKKRKIIGRVFIEVFDEEVKNFSSAKFLGQGTLYPDIIESVPIDGNPASLIKSHHNVGGLPEKMNLTLLEPLKQLFKDEVRALGLELGLPREVLWRQPFPGPGLGVRIMGDITPERLEILRKADYILIEEMKKSGWYYKVWQSFAVFLPVQTVGVMGDERTYEYVVALRIVESLDAMTADWVKMPYEILQKISSRIINEVRGVNRVVYDVSSKPPATIEWE